MDLSQIEFKGMRKADVEKALSLAYDAIRAKKGQNQAEFNKAADALIKLGVDADTQVKLFQQLENDAVDYGFLRSFAQGITFGFADELEALGKSALGGESYSKELANIRAGKAAYEGEYPMRALAGEVAGALPSALLPMGMLARGSQAIPALRTAARPAMTNPTFAGEAIKSGAIGGVEGAVGGFGRGEGTTERLEMAGREGAIGLGFGAAVPAVTGAAARGVEALTTPMDALTSRQIASRIKAGDEPRIQEEVRQRLVAGDTRPETLADIAGTSAQRQVRGSRVGSPEFDEEAGEFLTSRKMDAPQRVTEDVVAAGRQAGVDVTEELEKEVLEIAQAKAAFRHYQPLRQQYTELSLRDTGFDQFFGPDMISKEVYEKVVGDMKRFSVLEEADDVVGVPSYEEITKALSEGRDPVVPFSFLEAATRRIDSMSGMGSRAGDTATKASYGAVANRMKSLLDDRVAGYKEARQAFARSADEITANELGKRIKTLTPQQVRRRMAEFDDQARRTFVQSSLNKIVQGFDREGVDYATGIAGSRKMKEKLEALLGEAPEGTYAELLSNLRREQRMKAGGAEMTTRSDTASNLMEAQGQGFDLMQSPLQQAQQALVNKIGENLPARRSLANIEASRALMQTDPYAQQRTMQGVMSQVPTQRRMEGLASFSGRVGRVPSLLSPALTDKQGGVTIYTDEQLRNLGMEGLIR